MGRKIASAKTKYPKIPFSGNLNEKAYMLGLRSGDITAYRKGYLIRVSTGSTHQAQIKMFKEIFGKYTHTYTGIVKNNLSGKEWMIHCDLHNSFSFLIKKPLSIPDWISKNDENFYSFLTGYADSEGCWVIRKKNKNSISQEFHIATCDRTILQQIKSKLEGLGFNPKLYFRGEKGTISSTGIKHNFDSYDLNIHRKREVITLARTLLQFSHHEEKIQKMKLVLETENLEKWSCIENQVLNLRNKIKESRIKEIFEKNLS